jgi:hypothetical protein
MFGFGKNEMRDLAGHGRIALPSRLQAYASYQSEDVPEVTLFPFERDSNSFFYIGSNRVLIERLIVGLWGSASAEAAHRQTLLTAPYRTDSRQIQWRKEGEYEIGEGIQEVNAHTFPAWIVARDLASKRVTVAYTVWKKERSLQQAKALVDQALASFQ